jgi:hypothetical protein
MQFETLFAPAKEKPSSPRSSAAASSACRSSRSPPHGRLSIRAVADRDIERVEATLRAAGVAAAVCDSRAAAEAAFAADTVAICRSVEDLLALPIEIVVEATGDPEGGARFALAAIAAGRGVAMVSKEAECVVGPILARKAREAGVPYTLIDGDQPSLLVGLVSWARVLGLPIVAAGKSSEYDYVIDAKAGTVTWTDRTVPTPGLMKAWDLGDRVPERIAARTASSRTCRSARCRITARCAWSRTPRAYPRPARFPRALHAHDRAPGRLHPGRGRRVADAPRRARRVQLPAPPGRRELCRRRLRGRGARRREDRATSFAGKGIPVSRNRRYGLVYNPSHLLGVEAPTSIVAAARLKHDMVDASYRPVCDLVAKAETDLPGRPRARHRGHAPRGAGARAAAHGRHAGGRIEPVALLHGGRAPARAPRQGGRVHHRRCGGAAGPVGAVAPARRAGRRVPARLTRPPGAAQRSRLQALRKKSGAPKLPDFSASARSVPESGARPRHAGIDLGADRERLDVERAHHRAGGLAAQPRSSA